MAPSSKLLEAKLKRAVEEVYVEDASLLTVKHVRNRVASANDLDEDFFISPAWKDKSKTIIKEWAQKVMDGEVEPEPKSERKKNSPVRKAAAAVPKKDAKRKVGEEPMRPKKRQKKEPTPSESEDEEVEASFEDSAVSDFNDSDSSQPSKIKRRRSLDRKRTAKKGSGRSKAANSDESDLESEKSLSSEDENEDSAVSIPTNISQKAAAPQPKSVSSGKAGSRKVISEDESSDGDSSLEKEKKVKLPKSERASVSKAKSRQIISDDGSENSSTERPLPKRTKPVKELATKKITPKKTSFDLKSSFTKPSDTTGDAEAKANDSDSSEMSLVLDEAPKPKRKPKEPKAKQDGKPKKDVKTAKEPSDPETAQIKLLQSQLVKCGIRKIWAFALKDFKSDSDKIKHLRGMLRDAGMTGAFSEKRAKEIKEMRELQADLDAVREGETSWGRGSGTRRARGQRKSLQEDPEDDDAQENSEGDEEEKDDPAARLKAAKASLDFLGSDSESDSD